MLLQAILVGLIAAWGQVDAAVGSLYTDRPIFTGLLIGLALGDIQTGVIVGATLELFFMGAISMGSYIPPDSLVGGVLATAFAISGDLGIKAALALAMPIALISLGIKQVIYMIVTAMCSYADTFAKAGNEKGVIAIHFGATALKAINSFVWVFLAFYFGADAVTGAISALPQFILDGMSIAGGILPALGFAMLLNMVFSRKTLPYYFLGFVLSAYIGMPIIGILIIGAIIIAATIDWNMKDKEELADETF